MKEYLMNTVVQMKQNDRDKYWIDRSIISPIQVTAINTFEALKKYAEKVNNECYASITVSKTALKTANEMYKDGKDGTPMQIGYVLTGKTSIDNNEGRYIDKYIDLWVEMFEVAVPCFEKE